MVPVWVKNWFNGIKKRNHDTDTDRQQSYEGERSFALRTDNFGSTTANVAILLLQFK